MPFSFFSIPLPFSLSMLRRIGPVNPLIVNYHVVSNEKIPYIDNLYHYRNINTFKEDIDLLNKKYCPIALPDLLNHLKNNIKLPDNAFMLTFDDGFREMYDVVMPILLKRKLKATFFLTTDFLDNKTLGYMNKKSLIVNHLKRKINASVYDNITGFLNENYISGYSTEQCILSVPYKQRQLLDIIATMVHIDFQGILNENKPYLTNHQVGEMLHEGMTFGGHSIDHPRFSELSLEEQIFQSVNSTKYLQENFDLDYKVFAFPYTDLSISESFFSETADFFDATFGTQGMIKDGVRNNLQRVNLEKFTYSAKRTLKSLYVRRIYYNLTGKNVVIRDPIG